MNFIIVVLITVKNYKLANVPQSEVDHINYFIFTQLNIFVIIFKDKLKLCNM